MLQAIKDWMMGRPDSEIRMTNAKNNVYL